MLSIKNLHAKIEDKEILKGLNLEVKPGEVHAIMGPNGSGKSTLSSVIAGHEDYEITEGEIIYEGNIINEEAVEDRARDGIFLAFQYPIEFQEFQTLIFFAQRLMKFANPKEKRTFLRKNLCNVFAISLN